MSHHDPDWSDAVADRAWQDTRRLPRGDDLAAPATQVVGDPDDYLGQGRHDVGRRIAEDQFELFTEQEPAVALREAFQRHASEFITLHDVGTAASLRLLGALAGAGGARVQRLALRRQGQGVALAVLQFVEVPLADGSRVRVYATEVSADTGTRTALARALLGHSLLGVLLVGELPPHAMTTALLPLREAVARGPWPNRHVLLMPLGSGTALAAQAAQLAGSAPVEVRVTPRAGKPRTAWEYVAGAWNRLHGGPQGQRTLSSDLAWAVPPPPVPRFAAPTEPMPLPETLPATTAAPVHDAVGPAMAGTGATATGDEDALPPPLPHLALRELAATPDSAAAARAGVATAPAPMPVPGSARWDDYVQRCLGVKGAVCACVFDVPTLAPLAHAGAGPAPERLARQGALLLGAMGDAARALGLQATRSEAAMSIGGHHLLLRPVPGHPGVALHLLLQGSANLTLARMQLERVEAPG
jgi:hypothetical protein